ncbi:MAG TPA: hypothetical protein VJR06_08755 [Nitrososphaerales archaeon]|nr:hypothetical protein [Nitrososphaerales archaeon]
MGVAVGLVLLTLGVLLMLRPPVLPSPPVSSDVVASRRYKRELDNQRLLRLIDPTAFGIGVLIIEMISIFLAVL